MLQVRLESLEYRNAGHFRNAECACNHRGNQAGVRDRRQVHEERSIRVVAHCFRRNLQGQAGLSRSSRTRERQETHSREQFADLTDLVLTSDE